MMRRFSVEKAEWTDEREKIHKKECYKIEFYFKDRLVIENQSVHSIKGTEKIVISKPSREKSSWFETWTGLKKYYNI